MVWVVTLEESVVSLVELGVVSVQLGTLRRRHRPYFQLRRSPHSKLCTTARHSTRPSQSRLYCR